jgi:CheY-like chemotaxis protein
MMAVASSFSPSESGRRATLRPNGHRSILIVEDEADLRDMMSQLLKLEGYESAAVSNGREALMYLETDRPDLILLDLMMPVMDGWEFLRRQKADAHVADVPVIVLTALDRGRAGDIDVTEYLKKPLDFDRLLSLVRKYCH